MSVGLPVIVFISLIFLTISACQPASERAGLNSASQGERQGVPAVTDLLRGLEQRLEYQPDDARGWELLGHSYEFLGREADAEQAFARARALDSNRETGAAQPVQLTGTVQLDDELRDLVKGDETIFIFARAVGGPRMPLAILRKQVNELPVHFTLDDSMAMSPAARLSGFREVIVGARISVSGAAAASAGDLEGYSRLLTVGDPGPVLVTIDQAVIGRAERRGNGG